MSFKFKFLKYCYFFLKGFHSNFIIAPLVFINIAFVKAIFKF